MKAFFSRKCQFTAIHFMKLALKILHVTDKNQKDETLRFTCKRTRDVMHFFASCYFLLKTATLL